MFFFDPFPVAVVIDDDQCQRKQLLRKAALMQCCVQPVDPESIFINFVLFLGVLNSTCCMI